MQSAISVKEISFDSSLFNSFIRNRITKLYVDKKNSVIWLGTFGKGLVKSSMQDKDIHHIFLRDEIKEIICDYSGRFIEVTLPMEVYKKTQRSNKEKLSNRRCYMSPKAKTDINPMGI